MHQELVSHFASLSFKGSVEMTLAVGIVVNGLVFCLRMTGRMGGGRRSLTKNIRIRLNHWYFKIRVWIGYDTECL